MKFKNFIGKYYIIADSVSAFVLRIHKLRKVKDGFRLYYASTETIKKSDLKFDSSWTWVSTSNLKNNIVSTIDEAKLKLDLIGVRHAIYVEDGLTSSKITNIYDSEVDDTNE